MNRLIMSIVVCGMLAIGVPFPAHADTKVTMIEGIIEKVSDDSIVVNFKRHYLAGAVLCNTKNERVDMTKLRVGGKVAIYFRDKGIDCILIYPENLAE